MLCFLFTDTCILQNCEVTSPSVGTIRVSCDLSHQIQVNIICPDNCNNPIVTSSGYSPLTVMGLDPGQRYTVIIHVFDGNQLVLTNERITKTIIVMSTTSSKICDYANSCMYQNDYFTRVYSNEIIVNQDSR